MRARYTNSNHGSVVQLRQPTMVRYCMVVDEQTERPIDDICTKNASIWVRRENETRPSQLGVRLYFLTWNCIMPDLSRCGHEKQSEI